MGGGGQRALFMFIIFHSVMSFWPLIRNATDSDIIFCICVCVLCHTLLVVFLQCIGFREIFVCPPLRTVNHWLVIYCIMLVVLHSPLPSLQTLIKPILPPFNSHTPGKGDNITSSDKMYQRMEKEVSLLVIYFEYQKRRTFLRCKMVYDPQWKMRANCIFKLAISKVITPQSTIWLMRMENLFLGEIELVIETYISDHSFL